MVECPKCRATNASDAVFCDECGTRLEAVCPGCGEPNRAAAKFCRKCGRRLQEAPAAYTPQHLAERILTSRGALEGERKQVTVLFSDLKGSMELLADRDPEEARKILDPVLERMMEAVHHYEGTVNQVMGDGIMALFGAPLGHEDHAVRACYAALRMQESVARFGAEHQRGGGAPVAIRVGLNSGEVVVRAIGSDLHVDYTAVGQTTHLAARMEQIATPGTVLATSHTARLVEGYVEAIPRGPTAVKGLAAPVEVFEVTGAGSVRSRLQAAIARGLGPFVGRAGQLGEIARAAARARAGFGQAVGVAGEPGMGKSRLVYEFVRRERSTGWLVLESSAASYERSTACRPIIDLLQGYFGIETRDDTAAVRDKATARVARLDGALTDAIPALLALLEALPEDSAFLALEPRQRRHEMHEAAQRLLLRASRVQPLLLVVENLQWADSETEAFLDTLIEGLPGEAVLLLLSYRLQYQHRWGSIPHYTQLQVDPLPPDEAAALLDAELGADPALAPLKRLLIARAEGNPFFLEESVRTLAETGVIEREPGACRVTKPLESAQLPATVHALVASRIDRLSPEDKHLLQSAAVIGKDFSFSLVQAIAELPEDALRRGLAHLRAAELVREISLFPDLEYSFAQALTHEVAYASLLQDRRRMLHARIVQALEALTGDRLMDQVERLAHHAVRGELWAKAAAYLRLAGAKAAARSANAEAVQFFEQGLQALERLPESRETLEQGIDLRIDVRPPLLQLGRLDELLARSRQAEGMAQRLGDERRLAGVYTYLINYHYLKGEPDLAQQYGERCLAIAASSGDAGLRALASRYMGHLAHTQGQYERARLIFAENVEALETSQAADATIAYTASTGWLAFTLAEVGEFDFARAYLDKAQRAANAGRQAYAQAIAWTLAGLLWLRQGHLELAVQPLERSLQACRDKHLAVWQPIPSSLLGLTLALLGRPEEALPLLRAGVSLSEQLGVRAYLALWTLHLAEGLFAGGETDEALVATRRALDLALAHKERGHEAWARWLLGEIAARQAPPDLGAAESAYQDALGLAEALGMQPLQAHCHLGLGRVYRIGGDRARAEAYLAIAVGLLCELHMPGWLKRSQDELKQFGRLVIVARERRGLYELLSEALGEGQGLQIILDRRQGERRHQVVAWTEERRREERRRQEVDQRLLARGIAIV